MQLIFSHRSFRDIGWSGWHEIEQQSKTTIRYGGSTVLRRSLVTHDGLSGWKDLQWNFKGLLNSKFEKAGFHWLHYLGNNDLLEVFQVTCAQD